MNPGSVVFMAVAGGLLMGKPLRTMYVGLAVILTAVAVVGYGHSLRS